MNISALIISSYYVDWIDGDQPSNVNFGYGLERENNHKLALFDTSLVYGEFEVII
jgi:hypothetical protein